MSERKSSRFKAGDLVESVGPVLGNPHEPRPGEKGTLIDFDQLVTDEWVVSWERTTSIHAEMWLRLVNPDEAPPSG